MGVMEPLNEKKLLNIGKLLKFKRIKHKKALELDFYLRVSCSYNAIIQEREVSLDPRRG